MNKEQLHTYIENSTGNESNICQIYAINDTGTVYEDCWHGFKTDDPYYPKGIADCWDFKDALAIRLMEHLEIYCSLYLCITDEGDDKR